MNILNIRRYNLKVILDTVFAGNKAALARAIQRPASQVAKWLNGNENYQNSINDRSARYLEEILLKPPHWLDELDPMAEIPAETAISEGIADPGVLDTRLLWLRAAWLLGNEEHRDALARCAQNLLAKTICEINKRSID